VKRFFRRSAPVGLAVVLAGVAVAILATGATARSLANIQVCVLLPDTKSSVRWVQFDAPTLDKALKKALAGCFAIGAKYLGMTTSALNGRGGVQWIAWQRDEAFWSVGDRSTRCYLGPYPTRKIKGSIKGRRPPL